MSSISSGKGREEKREAQEIGRACERGRRGCGSGGARGMSKGRTL